MKRSLLLGLLVLVAAALLALPGSAVAKGGGASSHPNRGNHCGQGHAKHTQKAGRNCQKLTRNGGSAHGNGQPAGNPQAGGDDDQGDDNDQGDDDDQGGPGDDDDQGGPGDDDQGNDDQGDDDGGDED